MRARTIEQLAWVATIYRAAMANGEPPTRAVARQLDLSHMAAAKRVQRAREAGLLPSTARGRAMASEHVPTTAVVRRGSLREHAWRVCGSCLVAWPCAAWRERES